MIALAALKNVHRLQRVGPNQTRFAQHPLRIPVDKTNSCRFH